MAGLPPPPPAPAFVSLAPDMPGQSAGPPPPAAFGSPANTLDEPVSETIRRDLRRIGKNLVMVVFPFQDRTHQSAALRNWDLWGPMVFAITLAVTLSLGSAGSMSGTFSLVFALVSVGACVLTVNTVLLGGTIGFFQSLCLLGYCIFPLCVAAIISAAVKNLIVRWVVVPLCCVWSSWASVPFIAGAVPLNRRALAVYPLILLYAALGWLAIIA